MTNAEYLNFMYNPDNEFNCVECPENRGMDDWQDRLPCGQWNCWVTCHCRQSEDAEEMEQ